jgi:hypothetical protein
MGDAGNQIGQQLELAHWHLLRSDQLRASVAARAGSLMSANTLVVGGIAIILTLRGKPGLLAMIGSLLALLCVAVSTVAASMALITLRRWHVHFTERSWRKSFIYNSVNPQGVNTVDDFKERFHRESDRDRLDDALNELWRCGILHGYRYRRLRLASQALLAGIIFLLLGVASTGF